MAFYQLFSLALAWELDLIPRNKFHLLIYAALIFFGASAYFASRISLQGFVLFSTLSIHAINFINFSSLDREEMAKSMTDALLLSCAAISSAMMIQVFRGEVRTLFFPNKNLLCSFLNCGAILALSRIAGQKIELVPQSRLGRLLASRGTCFSILLLSLLTEYFFFSRGAAIALASGLLILGIYLKRSFILPLCGSMFLIISAILIFPKPMEGILWKGRFWIQDFRFEIWSSALRAWSEKPLFGWGLGQFGTAYRMHRIPMENSIGRFEFVTDFAHSEPLQVAVETGILGLILCGALIAAYVFPIQERLERMKRWPYGIAAAACLISLLVHSLIDFNLHLPLLTFLAVYFASYLYGSPKEQEILPPEKHTPSLMRRGVLLIWGAGCVVVLCSRSLGLWADWERNPKLLRWASALNPLDGKILEARMNASEGALREHLLNEMIRLEPGNDEPYAHLARFHFFKSDFKLALSLYDQAIERNPHQPFLMAESADCLLQMGQLEPALQRIEAAIRIEQFYVFAHYRAGEILLALNREAAARNYFENVLRIASYRLEPDSDYSKRLLEFDIELAKKRLDQIKLHERDQSHS